MITGRDTDKDDPIWLVKSGDRILGPYTKEEIRNLLMSREIVVIDEVTRPLKRWHYIRDEVAFAVIVEEIRKAHLNSREDTELGTVSKTVDDFSEHTGDFVPTSASFRQSTNIREAEVVDEVSIPQPTKRGGSPPDNVRSYGAANDQRVKEEVSRGNRTLWISAFVVLIVALFMFVKIQAPKATKVDGTVSELLAASVKARTLGDFRNTISIYEQIRLKGSVKPPLLLDLAVLRLKVGDSSTPPARILESIQSSKLSASDKAKYLTALGLNSVIEDNDLDEARKNFEKALDVDPNFAAAAFNRAMIDFIDPKTNFTDPGKANKLAGDFARVSEMDSLDISGKNAAKIIVAIVRLKNRETSLAKQTKEYLDTLQKNIVQYWQEASFLRAYARYLSGQASQASRDLRITLGADPFVTDEHVVDPYLYLAPLGWHALKPMCEEMFNESTARTGKKDVTFEAMFQFCRFKAGDDQEAAREAIKDLEARSISDPLVRSISAFMLMGISPDQAKAKVSDATEGVSWDLGRIIRGRLCGHDDLACLYRTFRETAMMPTSVYFYVGAARYFRSQGDPAQKALAKDTIESVEKKSPNYIPLLEYEAQEGH
jgi:tetratricopeptide (TPR) repeat protein